MIMVGRPPRLSQCTMTELVFPNDTNGLGNLMGGKLLYWMDICAAIVSQRHAGQVCVTASVDSVEFKSPIRQNEVVIVEGWANRAFRTSMEIELVVHAENAVTHQRRLCNTAFYTFVAIDDSGKPSPMVPVLPETPDEHRRYAAAAERRQRRLARR